MMPELNKMEEYYIHSKSNGYSMTTFMGTYWHTYGGLNLRDINMVEVDRKWYQCDNNRITSRYQPISGSVGIA